MKHVLKLLPKKSSGSVRTILIENLMKTSKVNGEDAYFVFKDSAYGIFDGVGGWSELGVDPSELSFAMASECLNHLDTSISQVDPKHLMDLAYNGVLKRGKVRAGGTTALTIILDKKSNVLHCANLGDCGVRVIECDKSKKVKGSAKIVHRSKEQLHYFNCPFQLSIVPPGKKHANTIRDTPALAKEFDIFLNPNSIVISGSDGVFDNIFDEKMVEIVNNELNNSVMNGSCFEIENVATQIFNEILKNAKNPRAFTPFSRGVSLSSGKRYLGGKMDDITLFVSSLK